MSYRIGQGYDAHQLKPNLPLILGGVSIPHTQGVVAHSDGDALIHAIIDAMLGAFSLGDIGTHFPNTTQWENASGLSMLKHIHQYINNLHNMRIINIDATIVLQKPKLLAYNNQIKSNINNILNLKNGLKDISIKATTTDQLGFIGAEKGIAVYAVCLAELLDNG